MYKKSFGCMINIPSTYPIIGGKKKNDGICGNFIIFMSKNEMPLSLICCNRVALHSIGKNHFDFKLKKKI